MSAILKTSFFNQAKATPALEKRELALIVAQTAWGEDIIRPLLKRLMDFVEDNEVKKALIVQLNDEHRHTKIYWNHIYSLDSGMSRKLSPLYESVCKESLDSSDPYELLASILICLESFAFGAFKFRRKVCEFNPTLQLDLEVEQDEIQHVDTGMRALESLLQAGHTFDKNKVIERVRRVTMAFRSRSFVEELENACGDYTLGSTAQSDLMKDYYLTCGDEFSFRLKKFLSVARSYEKIHG